MSAKQQYRRNQQIVEPQRSSNVELRATLGPKTSLQEAQQLYVVVCGVLL